MKKKKCSKCDKIKSLDEFVKDKRKSDGYRYIILQKKKELEEKYLTN